MLRITQRIFGALVFVAALLWLIRSEHLASHTASTAILAAAPDRVDPALEGELVAVRGAVEGTAPLSDGEFLVPGRYVVVSRTVHRRVWTTKPGPTPAHSTRTYAWDEQTAGEPLASVDIAADPARVGAHVFDASQPDFGKLEALDLAVDHVAERHKSEFLPDRGEFDLGGASRDAPDLGDLLVRIQVLRAGSVYTIIGRQRGDAIVPAALPAGDGVARLVATRQTLTERIAGEQIAARSSTWASRVSVFLAMVVASCMVIAPRETPRELWTAANHAIMLSLWLFTFATFVIMSTVEGTYSLMTAGIVTGFLAFAWSMASIPSGPQILR